MKKTIIICFTLLIIIISLPIVLFPYLTGQPKERSSTDSLSNSLSTGAYALVQKAFHDLEFEWVDYHIHLLGLGTEQAYANPKMLDWRNPTQFYRYKAYLKASGIKDEQFANKQYLERLTRLLSDFPKPGKSYLLAFDKFYNPEGQVNNAETEFYISNQYLAQTIEQYPNQFLPMISIHPFRLDAIEQLKAWHAKGVRFIKWLPNAMGMLPSDPKLLDYFAQVKKLDMVILTHTGIELAVDTEENQDLGNPLHWRMALDMGVKVIFAHVASLGECINLEDDHNLKSQKVPCFDLALKMLSEKKYQNNLFADISAVASVNRNSNVLPTLLARKDLHHRFVYGSDYPIPAINVMISTKLLASRGLLTDDEAKQLTEIYSYNPLLFYFVLNRTLRHPETGDKFPASLFYRNSRI